MSLLWRNVVVLILTFSDFWYPCCIRRWNEANTPLVGAFTFIGGTPRLPPCNILKKLQSTLNGDAVLGTNGFPTSSSWDSNTTRNNSFSNSQTLSGAEALSTSDNHVRQLPSMTVSPLQVITSTLDDNNFLTEYRNSVYLQRPVSLAKALSRMRQAVWRLQTSAPNGTVIRLEQRIYSGTTDPLAWLSAQVDASIKNPSSLVKGSPLFYMGGETTEVAVLGSIDTANITTDVWSSLSGDILPDNARWYGGEPFDPSSPRRGAWQAFGATGTSWWILPAVELRQETCSDGSNYSNTTTILAVHVKADSLSYVQSLLDEINYRQTETRAPTTLPPILSRDGCLPESLRGDVQDGQDLYEQAVQAALSELAGNKLQKVVLARPQQLYFGVQLSASSLLRRWKYGGHEGGTLFWMRPASAGSNEPYDNVRFSPDFVGCTPERLFRVKDQRISTEALAGTRPRGSTPAADAQLCQDLFASPKDMTENQLTGVYISKILQSFEKQGLVSLTTSNHVDNGVSTVFVRRLRHLQHICHSYSADIVNPDSIQNVTRYLLDQMHPTPAVCGLPASKALRFIREHESVGFDRGFYAGPVGYLGRDQSDIVVAIRSGLVQQRSSEEVKQDSRILSTMTLYAGAGIVPGSTVQGEWAETNYKLAVVGSLFPQSPFSLQGCKTPNSAWAAAFVEELIRNGITQFYISPGSRSTPLVVAVSQALRAHMGVVHAESVHDERAAAFRALGFARGAGKPAAVITSSGTAVANLYPALVEASMDGVPMILLTADRPYESRSTGANQAIDQVGIFSSTYIRWSRDILPPSDEVPISLALSDVDQAVDVARRLRGPVHLNIQFRENLAPDSGRIRSDNRVDAITKFDARHFTSTPKFHRWSVTGKRFTELLSYTSSFPDHFSVQEIADLIQSSKRGIIVVGNVRPPVVDGDNEDLLSIMDSISSFAERIGFPIFSGVQSAALRFRSTAVIPFAEHLVRNPTVKRTINPDLIIQLGAPLVSTELTALIQSTIEDSKETSHVLVHPHTPNERYDPDFTVTHRISTEVKPWVEAICQVVQNPPSSELVPLILLGRRLQRRMKDIVKRSVLAVSDADNSVSLSEPEIILALAESIEKSKRRALFLSNSMPIRDAEAFLYPLSERSEYNKEVDLCVVGTSRGASGIDGIISTAKGLAESCQCPTTLIVGDVSALHDISSLHAIGNDIKSHLRNANRELFPLTTIVVNNDGGGIFSFLPIAAHGSQVNFNEFFGTPTNSFDFKKGSEAFGIPCTVVEDVESFQRVYAEALKSREHRLLEACVTDRQTNVRIHAEISSRTNSLLDSILKPVQTCILTGANLFSRRSVNIVHTVKSRPKQARRTLLLLHGWMGEGSEWTGVSRFLSEKLLEDWSIITLDLPGHGYSRITSHLDIYKIRRSLDIESPRDTEKLSVEFLAHSVLSFLKESRDVEQIDAVAGYSLGGRVALAMQDMSELDEYTGLWGNNTKTILLGVAPRTARSANSIPSQGEKERVQKDDYLCEDIRRISRFALLRDIPLKDSHFLWTRFVDSWYEAPIWGGLRGSQNYNSLRRRRSQALHLQGDEIAGVLRGCSPPRDIPSTKVRLLDDDTLFLAGERDSKYTAIGKRIATSHGVRFRRIPNAGHALLVEAPETVAYFIAEFLASPCNNRTISHIEEECFDERHSRSDRKQEKIEFHDDAETSECFRTEKFTFALVNPYSSSGSKEHWGIGWGNTASTSCTSQSPRQGVLIEASFRDGSGRAIGEATPLQGVHAETISQVSRLFQNITQACTSTVVSFDNLPHENVLRLDGSLAAYLDSTLGPSLLPRRVRCAYAAVEMAVLGLASQASGIPLLPAIARARNMNLDHLQNSIWLNGIVLRKNDARKSASKNKVRQELYRDDKIAYSSIKVKVGHQDSEADYQAILEALERNDMIMRQKDGTKICRKIRLDANRAWTESEALEMVASLEGMDPLALEQIEFVEEPLQMKPDGDFCAHVGDLERFYERSGLMYALDESLADLAYECQYDYMLMQSILRTCFPSSSARGCSALVLKPTVIGLELSLQLATLARNELGIGAVFTSCFETGVALSYIAVLAAVSDSEVSKISRNGSLVPLYAHGLGTFEMLEKDKLRPAFATHLDVATGHLNVASLSRALFGLSLSELQSPYATTREFFDNLRPGPTFSATLSSPPATNPFEATPEAAVASSTGSTEDTDGEISFAISLELPFSASVAHARFTDLPQQPRWSPWLSSVAYSPQSASQSATAQTEWKLHIRSIPLTWRAVSTVSYDPWPSIAWESVAGLQNKGRVDFVSTATIQDACTMKVRLTARPPRILRPLFRSFALEAFVRDKVLKWSLEMFRDVVLADLATERGDVELGDALFTSVQDKAVALQAALGTTKTFDERIEEE